MDRQLEEVLKMAKLKVAWRRATERANAARARRSMLQTRAALKAAAQRRAEEEAELVREAGRRLEETIAREKEKAEEVARARRAQRQARRARRQAAREERRRVAEERERREAEELERERRRAEVEGREREREERARAAGERAKRTREWERECRRQFGEQPGPEPKQARLLTERDRMVEAVWEHDRLLKTGRWQQAWELLGVAEAPTTARDARRAYLRLLVKVHPDKREATSGLSIEVYTEATKWITTWMETWSE